ncbi:metallophosphoesterase [Pseudomonas guariconensis]|uniref:metallophosphoesterase n=1 Tax=Pseudomonas guariconensis TaxID=1288410 RepID=UPI0018AC5B4B|nr:metallophosphoesterase [Pseudomonas guariconensis]MBF8741182.1 metallophosphoesterase [Pseudomonas guariconensis]MBF8751944.1 metallophosphoesterase [Pseudomonas guariconensis]
MNRTTSFNDAPTQTTKSAITQDAFCWVITSDPQYPRTIEYGYDNSKEGKALSSSQIAEQYAHINTYRDTHPQGRDSVPVFINGDITEFYHGDQVNEMNKQIAKLGRSVYMGLGNHDYDNNVNDCYRNGCARDAVLDMFEHAKSLAPDALDFKNVIWDNTTGYKLYRGSLAYSKTLGDFMFIQLHNHPAYATKFNADADPRWSLRFDITQSLDWLEGQLKNARNNKKHVIVNIHREPTDSHYSKDDNDRFQRLVNEYDVKAIFHGHTHVARQEKNVGAVPVFNSGAAFTKTFLVAETHTRHATVYIKRATKNIIESKPMGSFKLGEPITAPRVHASYRIAANEVYVTLHQTPDHQLAWERVIYTFDGKARTVYFAKNQNAAEEIHLNFDNLKPNTTYGITLVGHTDKGTTATHNGSIKTPDQIMAPGRFCPEKYPNWEQHGFIARWERPTNDNWPKSTMFEVGVFSENNSLIKTVGTTPDFHCPIPVSIYHSYKHMKYYIGVRAFNMVSPGDKSLPAKHLISRLPSMNC